jgi:hypothetical protein
MTVTKGGFTKLMNVVCAIEFKVLQKESGLKIDVREG